MALSKSTRMYILLVIDTIFFLIELIIGYSVHSLALVADSFHMLNDIISLFIGIWAVKVASDTTSSKTYTYGKQRAETLGALINGVFLVALCLTICLEAISRFVEPQEISSPKLVLIVGCCGLGSNFLGLLLFHDHSHSHAHEGVEQQTGRTDLEAQTGVHTDPLEGEAYQGQIADQSGNIADVLPQAVVGNWPQSKGAPSRHARGSSGSYLFTKSDEDKSTPVAPGSPVSTRKSISHDSPKRHRRRTSGSRARLSSVEDIPGHPASFRNEIIAQARMDPIDSATDESEAEGEVDHDVDEHTETSPLLHRSSKPGSHAKRFPYSNEPPPEMNGINSHDKHRHRQPKPTASKSGHSHSDLNMRGVFLHVLGDALGNIGVILAALFIWLTDYSWRFYSDPAISLLITVIILYSAIPLCKAASQILLQAVPAWIDVDDIRADIEDLPGVVSCHHLHVWQLNERKMIASLHVQVAFRFEGEGSARYMELARAVRTCLHEHGIHNSTIQPEFCLDESHDHIDTAKNSSSEHDGASTPALRTSKRASQNVSRQPSLRSLADPCLLDCDARCGDRGKCCDPAKKGNEESRS